MKSTFNLKIIWNADFMSLKIIIKLKYFLMMLNKLSSLILII